MWHTWHDLNQAHVKEIARDMQTANAGVSKAPASNRHIGRVWRWLISRRKPQTSVTIPANRLQQETS